MGFSTTNITSRPANPLNFEGIVALAFCLCANGLWAQGLRCPPPQPPKGAQFWLTVKAPLFARLDWLPLWGLGDKQPQSCVVLPRWSAAEMPLFCKIEHQIGRRLPMPFKFRLGSVEYVDWLEGKARQW